MPYTLTVNFNTPTTGIASTGYRAKYWPVSNPTNISTVIISSSPFQVAGLTECCYAGTIETICGSGQYSTPQNFSANFDYYYYTATKFDCGNSCAQVGASGSIVARSSTFLSPGNALYFKSGSFTYQLVNLMPNDPVTYDVDLDGTTSGANCNAVCGTAGTGNITIQNQTQGIISFGDFTPAWFTIDTGSVSPLTGGASATGTHGGYTGNMSITLSSVSQTGCLVIRVNGTVVGDSAVTAAGIYQFNGLSILNTDVVIIQFVVTCP